ncbi:MAG: ABC transporter permease [Planctomycetia bacterium]|nr:ABC transporter permease [Planctomycetia bacterium]
MNFSRLATLIVKEGKQLLRDPFSIILGILLPIIMLLICGFGMSTDIRNIPLAIVIPETSKYTTQLVARFVASDYFDVILTHSSAEGERLVKNHQADACLFLPQKFTQKLHGGNLQIMIAINASNPSLAYTKESYIKAVLLSGLNSDQTELLSGGTNAFLSESSLAGSILDLKPRLWFNDANVSAFTLIPGIIVIIMVVVGALLTSMVMAREYEQGNLESMFVTPMRSSEILLAKMINNYLLGMIGLGISLLMAHFVFYVPIRASWYVIPLGSSVFLIMALCMGLLISSLTKNQFIAVEIAAFTTFLPSFLLSGFLFEIKSMPILLQWITVFVPARYYVDFLQTAFLVGNVWPNIIKNIGILLVFAAVFMFLAKIKNPKNLEG